MLSEQRENIMKALNECDCEHEVNECNDGVQEEGILSNFIDSINKYKDVKFFTKNNNGILDVLSTNPDIKEPVTRIFPKHNSDSVTMFIPKSFGFGVSRDFTNADEAIAFLTALEKAKDKETEKFNSKYTLKNQLQESSDAEINVVLSNWPELKDKFNGISQKDNTYKNPLEIWKDLKTSINNTFKRTNRFPEGELINYKKDSLNGDCIFKFISSDDKSATYQYVGTVS